MRTPPLAKRGAHSTRLVERSRSSNSATSLVSKMLSSRIKEIKVVRRVRDVVVVHPIPKMETCTVRQEIEPAPFPSLSAKPLPIHQGLVELAQLDTVKQLRAMKSRFGTHMPSDENLVYAYTCAAALRVDEDEWQLFCMASEWRRRRKKPTLSSENRADALMYVMRFLHGTGNNVARPVKLAMKRLRPYWADNVSPFELHMALDREASPYTGATVAVRFVDNDASRQLLAHQAGTGGSLQFKILPGKGRSKHVLEISGVHIEPL